MKIILVAINAKYIHTNLAVRSIRETLKSKGHTCQIREYAINQPVESVFLDLMEANPELILFSTYIWNGQMVMELVEMISKVSNIPIIMGGPEIGFREESYLNQLPVKAIISGYGEGMVLSLVEKGLKSSKIVKGEETRIPIEELPFPYEEQELVELKDRILYYEGSRGCPFRCSFCLSGLDKTYEERSVDMVLSHMKKFIDADVKQVKFVDRTFNTRPERALRIMKGILALEPSRTNFHFEMTAERISEEMLSFLEQVPEGLFQFEIGVQSIHKETLEAVNRKNDFAVLDDILPKLSQIKGVHVHLDLIAGLPFETLSMFRQSFDKVYGYGAEKLQLGFLKLIYGSQLYEQREQYGYRYCSFGMYEILESNWISNEELRELKKIEEMVEKFGNEEYFKKSLGEIQKNYHSPYQMFLSLAQYWYGKQYDRSNHQRVMLYEILYGFIGEMKFSNQEEILEYLIFDFFSTQNSGVRPVFLKEDSHLHEKKYDILGDDSFRAILPKAYQEIPAKKLAKHFALWQFSKVNPIKGSFITAPIYLLFDDKGDRGNKVFEEDVKEK